MIRWRSFGALLLLIVRLGVFANDPSIPRDIHHINVGQRVRMDCELNSSIIADHRKVIFFVVLLLDRSIDRFLL